MVLVNRNLDRLDKVNLFLSVLIIASLIVAIAISIYNSDWWTVFIGSLALFLALSPTFFEWKYDIDIPTEFELVIIAFVYASLFLGEAQQFYFRFWWWDKLLHLGSGIALGFIGFATMYILYKNQRLKASPFLIVVFAFCFSLALSSLWEIFEFNMDYWFGTNMQKSGLIDTMLDLIVDTIGALIVAVPGYIYLRIKKNHLVDWMIERFLRKNPDWFT